MKQLKRFMIVVFMLLGCVAIQATDDLITQQITITLDKAGTLSSKIGSTKKYKITNLKIIGEINGTDLRMIRDMAGCNYQGNSTSGKLATLDLSEVKIVSGGDYYYVYSYYYKDRYNYTEDNVLGKRAFFKCRSLTSVEIPSSVTSIDDYAFRGCSSLTSIEIPSSVTSIGGFAFYGCSSLTSVEIPSSVTSIGNSAFSYCSSLTSVEIPSGVTSIGNATFLGCSSLTSIEIPSSVTSIGDSAFNGCSSLTSIEIPSSVTSIGSNAFSGCSSLASVEIPSSVTSISSGAFQNCSSLTSVVIPSSVTSIGYGVFYQCSKLASVEIPSSVTSIGECAFESCSSLTSIEIPSSVTSIGDYAFRYCSSLTSIYVSWETPVSITSGVFNYVDMQKCTLYIPQGTYRDYLNAVGWRYFKNIVEYDATGVDNVSTSTNVQEVARYSLNGQRLTAPTGGVNIVKYSDGSVKKVVVQ